MKINNKEYSNLKQAARDLMLPKTTLESILLEHGDFSTKEVANAIKSAQKGKNGGVVINGVHYISLREAAQKHHTSTNHLSHMLRTLGHKTDLVYVLGSDRFNQVGVAWNKGPIKIAGQEFASLTDFANQSKLSHNQILKNMREFGSDSEKMWLMRNNEQRYSVTIAGQCFGSKMQAMELYDMSALDLKLNMISYGTDSKNCLILKPSGNLPHMVHYDQVFKFIPAPYINDFLKMFAKIKDSDISYRVPRVSDKDSGIEYPNNKPIDVFNAKYLYDFYNKVGFLK